MYFVFDGRLVNNHLSLLIKRFNNFLISFLINFIELVNNLCFYNRLVSVDLKNRE